MTSLRRSFSVAGAVLRAAAGFGGRVVVHRLRGDRPIASLLGESLTELFETAGGGLLKAGQVLSSRWDLLAPDIAVPLQRLQDAVAPMPFVMVRSIVERTLDRPLGDVFGTFDAAPLGSGSIAQVHGARLRHSGLAVAVKVRRAGIDAILRSDAMAIRSVAAAAARIPAWRSLPIRDGARQLADCLAAQADFRREAASQRRACALFAVEGAVRIPRLVDELCTGQLLVMERVAGLRRIADPTVPDEVRRGAVVAGLRALYSMVFLEGLVHCDLHPGNILVAPDGRPVFLDWGFAAEMTPRERESFAHFFVSLALNDGRRAARIVRDTARFVPPTLDVARFEDDVARLVSSVSRVAAREFIVGDFVRRLFQIQRRHRIYGSPSFTMAIVSLVVYEGLIRSAAADVDFQAEAMPVLVRAFDAARVRV